METETTLNNVFVDSTKMDDKEYYRLRAKYQNLTGKQSRKIFWLYATVIFLLITSLMLALAFTVYGRYTTYDTTSRRA